jgi:simple sugar transport system substrate-binding protein
MVDALSECQSRGIPVVALNAVPEDEIGPDLPYIGQFDYQSGREAGKRFLAAKVKKGWCLVHADLSSLQERCRGMEDAFLESGANYLGMLRVSTNYQDDYMDIVEKNLGSGNWTEHGILSSGQIQIPSLLSVVNRHPEVKAGTFDVDENLDTRSLLFVIDQQPYLQGYTALAMALWSLNNAELKVTEAVATGPKFETGIPKRERRKCEGRAFEVCSSTTPLPPLKHSGKCAELGRLCEECEGIRNESLQQNLHCRNDPDSIPTFLFC